MSSKTLHIVGYTGCRFHAAALAAGKNLADKHPEFVVDQKTNPRSEYMAWLQEHRDGLGAGGHSTSPIVWINDNEYIGICAVLRVVWC